MKSIRRVVAVVAVVGGVLEWTDGFASPRCRAVPWLRPSEPVTRAFPSSLYIGSSLSLGPHGPSWDLPPATLLACCCLVPVLRIMWLQVANQRNQTAPAKPAVTLVRSGRAGTKLAVTNATTRTKAPSRSVTTLSGSDDTNGWTFLGRSAFTDRETPNAKSTGSSGFWGSGWDRDSSSTDSGSSSSWSSDSCSDGDSSCSDGGSSDGGGGDGGGGD